MNPQERELIESVFGRLSQTANAPKDAEAQSLIAGHMARQPDAAYGMVQAVIVLESALKGAQAQIAELERRLSQSAAPAGGGGFLNGAPNPWAASTPRPAPPQQSYAPAPAQPAYAPPQQAYAQPVTGGTPSFLQQAGTMAAGVAGGVLLAEGVSSLFSGHHGGGFGGGFGGGGGFAGDYGQPSTVENVVVNNYYGDDTDRQTAQDSYVPTDDQTAYDDTDSDLGAGGSDDSWM